MIAAFLFSGVSSPAVVSTAVFPSCSIVIVIERRGSGDFGTYAGGLQAQEAGIRAGRRRIDGISDRKEKEGMEKTKVTGWLLPLLLRPFRLFQTVL